MVEARAKVSVLLDALEERLRPSKVVLGGFSQGAMIACDVALHSRGPAPGSSSFSEPRGRRRVGASLRQRRGLPVLQSHGREDPLLPFAFAERLRDLMRDGGMEVTWTPFRGGHEIPRPVLDATGRWLREVFV